MRKPVNGIKKDKISITLDGDLLQKVRARAEAEERSVAQYINRVLKIVIREAEEKEKESGNA